MRGEGGLKAVWNISENSSDLDPSLRNLIKKEHKPSCTTISPALSIFGIL